MLTEYKMSKVLKSRNDIILEKENTHLWKNSNKQLAQLTLDFGLRTIINRNVCQYVRRMLVLQTGSGKILIEHENGWQS